MARLFPATGDWRFVHGEEEISASFGSDGDVHIPIIEDDDDSSVSDCESVVSGNIIEEQATIQPDGLIRLDESDQLHRIIAKKFVSRLSYFGVNAQIQYIGRNLFNASAISQARLNSFQIFTKAIEKKNGGQGKIKYGWFGASKDEISNIILHGFGYDNIQKNCNSFVHGIVLSADHSPLESVESATVDDDGIKHILLCRVLLGKTELVNRNSAQCHPSSEDFQTGVDDLGSPKKYIVWSSQMNTHILPEFVISFKIPSMNNEGIRVQKPVSPWIPIPELIAALSKILPPKSIKEISRNYIEGKICRREMIKGMREVAGDRVLLMLLKDFTHQRRGNLKRDSSKNMMTRFFILMQLK